MSECVVRMKTPKGCGSCPIANFGYCSIDHKQVGDPLMGYPENRTANCPIICSLPKGHGRLIDADALKDYFVSEAASYDLTQGQMGILSEAIDMIDEQPTIVPAEAERSET